MSASTELPSVSPPIKRDSESRKILGPTENRVKVIGEENESLKKEVVGKISKRSAVRLVKRTPQIVFRKNDDSVDSSCSLRSSSSSGSSVKIATSKRREKHDGNMKLEGEEAPMLTLSIPFKRCDWITNFSDPIHVSFHDEEWGVPVYDDSKLFELLVLSQISAELTWPEILYKRDKFRKVFEDFNPSSIANFPEDRLLSSRPNGGGMLLSEQKLRSIIGNAVSFLKIQQEFGSFNKYCWRFFNNKPIKNGFRYARQVPAKTPKSEVISKDLMRRGFRCVGPTIIYSFMQISGMVNDHLVSCFRYMECNNIVKKNLKPKAKQEAKNLDDTHLSNE